MKIWLFLSPVKLHKKHLGTSCLPFFCRTSSIKHPLFITNQVKHFNFLGMSLFQKQFQLYFGALVIPVSPLLQALLTQKTPSLLCFHRILYVVVAVIIIPASFSSGTVTLYTSQSLSSLLKDMSHPCSFQQSLTLASEFSHIRNF